MIIHLVFSALISATDLNAPTLQWL